MLLRFYKNKWIQKLSLALFVSVLLSFVTHKTINARTVKDEFYHAERVAFSSQDAALKSLQWIFKRGNKDMVPHLILALRYTNLPHRSVIDVLQGLTEHYSAKDWFEWMLWLEQNEDIKAHKSYTRFKRVILRSIDPRFSTFVNENLKYDIRLEEIVWGGVRVDGIPALDNPKFVSAQEAEYLYAEDEVFGIEINGDVRAYPLRIMGWHEMFNDVIGGVPVSLAYCTLCGAGILYETKIEDEWKYGLTKPLSFGSSGLLYRSNKLMYDRETNSLWNQLTGEPVSGRLKGRGLQLKIRPVVITTWGNWYKMHPDSKVLSIDTGYRRNYGSGVVYKEYFESGRLMFPAIGDRRDKRNRVLDKKDQIFGVRVKAGTKAWAVEDLNKKVILNDRVGGTNLILISEGSGRSIRAYDRKDYMFTDVLKTSDGQMWTFTEDALVNEKGERLKRVPGHISYWFAWAGYFGDESALYFR